MRLMDRVYGDWIEGVLDSSLHRMAWLDLGLDWTPEAVEHPWDGFLLTPDRPIQRLETRRSVASAFADAKNTLLILGEPGSGKTTTLLELGRELIHRSRGEGGQVVPVVLALSSWSARFRRFKDFAASELSLRYQVPKSLGIVWLECGRLLLLLDGLDELAEPLRRTCVQGINSLMAECDLPGIGVILLW